MKFRDAFLSEVITIASVGVMGVKGVKNTASVRRPPLIGSKAAMKASKLRNAPKTMLKTKSV
jgi:hypothetical protein